MNLKSAIILSILFIALNPTFSQNKKSDRKINNDPKAQEILDKVSEKYKNLKTLESSFSLSMVSKADDINEKYNGKVVLKGNKYVVDTELMEIVCDNAKRYIWMKETNEVSINLYEPDGETIESPSQLFTIYQKDFFYRYNGTEKSGNKNLSKIELIPEKLRQSQYKRIYLFIDENIYQITKAIIESKDGVVYTWDIISFKPNVNVDDKIFVFEKSRYPKTAHFEDMTK